jgi:hypothetical protein
LNPVGSYPQDLLADLQPYLHVVAVAVAADIVFVAANEAMKPLIKPTV